MKVLAPAECKLPVEQQPKIKEVIQRQPDGRAMSEVEQILGKGILEQTSLQTSKRQRRPPDRLRLMCTNKNS